MGESVVPQVEEALAATKQTIVSRRPAAVAHLQHHAPEWLAALCAEVKALRSVADEEYERRTIADAAREAAESKERQLRARSERVVKILDGMVGVPAKHLRDGRIPEWLQLCAARARAALTREENEKGSNEP